MDYLINKLKNYPFSGKDIVTACDGHTKIILYSDIHKFKSIDQLLKPYNNAVILYQTKPNYGHWVLLMKKGNVIEFFDSYGLFIDEQLNFISKEFKKVSHQDFPYLSNLLLKSKYKIIYNPVRLQKTDNDISSCGRHVCLRLILKDLSLKDYIKMIKHNKYDPDSLVTYLTAFV
jgi:hypothetical protein